jgi:hypothetical protein
MWRAAGSDPARQPSEWLRSADAAKFIDAVSELLNLGKSQVLVAVPGRNGGTRAHWQIGLAYAKYLSPEFHMWCNTTVRAYMEGKLVSGRELLATKADLKALQVQLAEVQRSLVFIAEAYDSTIETSVVFKPMVKFLIAEGVLPKGRRGLSVRCSKMLLQIAVREQRLQQVRNGKDGKWQFHVDLYRSWLATGGAEIIRAHKDATLGQNVFQFRKRKSSGGPAA